MAKAKVVSFIHHKGGTGKTSSCLSIAGYLAKEGKSVLVVDLDPQANATSGLGIDTKTVRKSMYHVLGKKAPIRNTILQTATENIHLAPSQTNLAYCDKKNYKTKKEALQLNNILQKVKKNYDFILVDTPPTSGHFIINAALAADEVALVLDPGIFALEGVESIFNAFDEYTKTMKKSVNISMALLTKCQKSLFSNPTKEVKEELQKLNLTVFSIPHSNKMYYSQLQGIPISHYKPKSNVGIAYQKVAQSLLG